MYCTVQYKQVDNKSAGWLGPRKGRSSRKPENQSLQGGVMNRLAGLFMKTGVIYALLGFSLGIFMAAGKDFTLRSVHTHLNLIGWASMAVYAMYYQLVPVASAMRTAKVHFWVANTGLVVLTVSVGMLASGYAAAEAGAALGSIVTLASLLLFIFIVFKSS